MGVEIGRRITEVGGGIFSGGGFLFFRTKTSLSRRRNSHFGTGFERDFWFLYPLWGCCEEVI